MIICLLYTKIKELLLRLVVPGCDEIITVVRRDTNKNIINYYTNCQNFWTMTKNYDDIILLCAVVSTVLVLN